MKFIDLEDNTDIFVHTFNEINTRYGKTYILACTKGDITKEETEINMYWRAQNITTYINNDINSYKLLSINNIAVYGTLTGTPFLSLRKTGTYISATKNKSAAMQIINKTENKSVEDTSYRLSRKLVFSSTKYKS